MPCRHKRRMTRKRRSTHSSNSSMKIVAKGMEGVIAVTALGVTANTLSNMVKK